MDQLALQAGSLIAQLSGTAVIAWLAVRWAISRFKLEKSWENQLSVYTRTVAAIGEMRTINLIRLNDIEEHVDRTEEYNVHLNDRYRVAQQEFDHCVAISRLILSEEAHRAFATLQRDVRRFDANDIHSFYDGITDILSNGMDAIVEQGRLALR